MRRLIVALCLLASALPVRAWDDHALVTAAALGGVLAGAPPVRAEPLEAFLRAAGPRVAAALEDEERWARARGFPPRPDDLRLDPAAGDLRASFLGALRANPRLPLRLYAKELPGAAPRTPLAWSDVATLPTPPPHARFGAIADGEPVAPLDVVATAADEPDHGLDVGLFSDSGTPWGKHYGFGPLPFGNPGLEFATQAPFHMGFFHEPGWIYRAAPFLRRTYPELRIHQCAALARVAFATGHAYWGWRFLGWGLHYVQDLGQPYHATPLPGASRAIAILKNALGMVGVHGPRDRMVQLVSNRHLAMEAVASAALRTELGGSGGPLSRALRDGGPGDRWREDDPRDTVSAASARVADAFDGAVERWLPPRWTLDPAFRAGEKGFAVDPSVLTAEQRAGIEKVLAERLADVGVQTRRYEAAVAP